MDAKLDKPDSDPRLAVAPGTTDAWTPPPDSRLTFNPFEPGHSGRHPCPVRGCEGSLAVEPAGQSVVVTCTDLDCSFREVVRRPAVVRVATSPIEIGPDRFEPPSWARRRAAANAKAKAAEPPEDEGDSGEQEIVTPSATAVPKHRRSARSTPVPRAAGEPLPVLEMPDMPKQTCEVAGCGKDALPSGLCGQHSQRWYNCKRPDRAAWCAAGGMTPVDWRLHLEAKERPAGKNSKPLPVATNGTCGSCGTTLDDDGWCSKCEGRPSASRRETRTERKTSTSPLSPQVASTRDVGTAVQDAVNEGEAFRGVGLSAPMATAIAASPIQTTIYLLRDKARQLASLADQLEDVHAQTPVLAGA